MNPSLTPSLQRSFLSLACRLSPENLHMDGECSQKQAQLRYLQIKREWAALEVRAGRTVGEDEVWQFASASRP